MVSEIEITTLGEFVDLITPQEPDPATGRRRDSGVYRGMADARARLLSRLDRLGGIDPPHSKIGLEEHIFRNFKKYARPFLTMPPQNDWELLAGAQHHGLPTRLLDWSYSPLIAAHFATYRTLPGFRPAVWRLDWKTVHRHFGFSDLVLSITEIESLFEGKGPFTPWDLFNAASIPRPFACMFEPPSLDTRIVTQSATFTLCSDASRPFDEFLDEHGLADPLTKFVVPESALPRFRDQLDLVGIDERRLFPDLDGLAAELRRYYS